MGWIQTYTGKRFEIENISPDSICIEDISIALSRQCRFAGHCLDFYSVAEHCVLISEFAPPELKLAALLHDASEAYLVDIPRPVKVLLPDYLKIEEAVMGAIASKYGFEWPLNPLVKELDNSILTDERQQNMCDHGEGSKDWGNDYAPLKVKLRYWKPDEAAFMFLKRFWLCGGKE